MMSGMGRFVLCRGQAEVIWNRQKQHASGVTRTPQTGGEWPSSCPSLHDRFDGSAPGNGCSSGRIRSPLGVPNRAHQQPIYTWELRLKLSNVT